MTNENKKDIKKEIADAFLDYSFEVIKGIFVILDSLLSHCNTFEDFKAGVKRTVDNLAKTEGEEEKK